MTIPGLVLDRLASLFHLLIVPDRCHLCQGFLPPDEAGEFVCSDCRARLKPASHPYCPVCGRPFPSPLGEDRLCQDCFQTPRPYEAARFVAAYDEPLAAAIRSFKYSGRVELAASLGALAKDFNPEPPFPERFDYILPVPLHPKRLKARGFNQAILIGNGLERFGPLECCLLVRTRETKPQAGLSSRERRLNVKGAFGLSHSDRVAGKTVLVIDDVFTTGATIEECARTIKKAGAKAVYALTLARVM